MLSWVLDKTGVHNWSILGALSTEDRCLATWSLLRDRAYLAKTRLFEIKDNDSRFTDQTTAMLELRHREFLNSGGSIHALRSCNLFASPAQIVDEFREFLAQSGPNVIVDITSLPKRFFFPLVKQLVEDTHVENLIASYAIPKSYTSSPLSEGFQEWRALPLFFPADEKDYSVFIISIGFLPMGLPEQVKQHCGRMPVKLIFPFPPGPPSYHRSWEFVMDLERDLSSSPLLTHVDSRDASLAFDCLAAMTDSGTKPAILAPYGPKPHSLAMCLFATLTDSMVCYTQPTVYHPEYSKGVSLKNGNPEIYGYWIRMGGRSLYEI
jgi:hypothetical protein